MSVKTTSRRVGKAAAGPGYAAMRRKGRGRALANAAFVLLGGALGVGRQVQYRYREQLWPLWILGILLLAGAIVPLAPAAGVAATSALASLGVLFHLRGKLERNVERMYAVSCLATASTWLTFTSALGSERVVNVPAVLAWAVASVVWWRHHQAGSTRPIVTATPIQDLWAANVAAKGRVADGAVMGAAAPIEHGAEYPIQGVPGVHHIGQMQAAIPQISSGLRTPLQYLILESEEAPKGRRPDPSRFRLRVVERSPIDKPVFFHGPRMEGGRLILGPYADGEGEIAWRVFTADSMWGGFILGGTGAGKSRLIELIALTLMANGVAVAYLDGQSGASSPMLWKKALWRGGPEDAKIFLAAWERGMKHRQAYLRHKGDAGLNPEEGGPTPLMLIVDECHKIFKPDTGERWGHVAREQRKLLMGLIAASQYSGLPTFGGSDPLRTSLLDGNGAAMRISSRISTQLVPGLDLDPAKFPALPGYLYYIAAADSDARTAPGRGEWLPGERDKERFSSIPVPTVQEWFERIPQPELDGLTARAFGDEFLRRHERAAEQEEADRRLVFGDDEPFELTDDPADPPAEARRIEDARSLTCSELILDLPWDDHSGEMERAQIIAELPAELDVSTVRKALSKLVDNGNLDNPSRGIYRRVSNRRAA